jgi:HrpA-like RNA helicase
LEAKSANDRNTKQTKVNRKNIMKNRQTIIIIVSGKTGAGLTTQVAAEVGLD